MNDDQTLYEEYEKRCNMKFTATLEKIDVVSTQKYKDITYGARATFEGFKKQIYLDSDDVVEFKQSLTPGKGYIITIEEIK